MRYPGDYKEIIKEIHGDYCKIVVPLGDTWRLQEIVIPLEVTLGVMWRLHRHQEIPWGLHGVYSTTSRYPGDYMEIVVPLGDTWSRQGDFSTTRRYTVDYMEILLPLGDSLGIIWRLFYRYENLKSLGRLQHHQVIPGDYRDIEYNQEKPWDNMEILVPLGDTMGIIWRLQHNQEIPWEFFGACSTTRRYMETIWRLQYYQQKPWV